MSEGYEEEAQEAERQRLFRIIEELGKWENINNEYVLKQAREEILKSTDGNPPPVYDPFCGGGSIPLEAQRLGLEAHGSDLNPAAVLITKALIEILRSLPIVRLSIRRNAKRSVMVKGGAAQGLAEDVRYYGKWMRDEAEKRIGNRVWVEPVIDRKYQPPTVTFEVKSGKGSPPNSTVNRRGATCICCKKPVSLDHIRNEGKTKRMGILLKWQKVVENK